MTAAQFKDGKIHAVYAGGGPQDGSLYGFKTLCGRPIWRRDLWREMPDAEPDCGHCVRAIERERKQQADYEREGERAEWEEEMTL